MLGASASRSSAMPQHTTRKAFGAMALTREPAAFSAGCTVEVDRDMFLEKEREAPRELGERGVRKSLGLPQRLFY